MLTFKAFSGINNVQPEHRLKKSELRAALNVDIGISGELRRRSGYSSVLGTCHKNLWQARGFMLATVDGNDLSSFTTPAGARTVVSAALGPARVWYVNLPDGRTAFSNGSICGLTAGAAATKWGVPTPSSVGAAAAIAGQLAAGDYRYLITHVRTAGGLEGAPKHSGVVTLGANSGLSLTGLPVLAGHTVNIYITGTNGGEAYLAGSTAGSTFSFAGSAASLVIPCRTEFLSPAPAGRCLAFWRGRVLVAVGPVLYASLPGRWEHFDLRRDFKQLPTDITAVVPVHDGLYVGTTSELLFLSGEAFDELTYTAVAPGAVVLGSGIAVPGDRVKKGDDTGAGDAALFIAGGSLVAGFKNGEVEHLTENVYATAATEVSAVFRETNGVPQYIALPQ